jgi:DEAD/DEAH box helicase domain-containing protein
MITNFYSTLDAKPVKAFGAPETDEEEGSDQDDSEGDTDTDEEERRASPEEKRKTKTTKVEDGESGEATLLQLRAKLFALESKEAGWKERGVGILKINVPKSCASYDENGAPLSGSFDISGLKDEDEEDTTGPHVPRLIMRQENTHRVILNTVIVRAMEFKDKPSTSAAQIIFTAFEGEKEPKPIQMLLRVSSPFFETLNHN